MEGQIVYRETSLISIDFIQKSMVDCDYLYKVAQLDAVCNAVQWISDHKLCGECVIIRCPCNFQFKYDVRDYLVPYCLRCEKFLDKYKVVQGKRQARRPFKEIN